MLRKQTKKLQNSRSLRTIESLDSRILMAGDGIDGGAFGHDPIGHQPIDGLPPIIDAGMPDVDPQDPIIRPGDIVLPNPDDIINDFPFPGDDFRPAPNASTQLQLIQNLMSEIGIQSLDELESIRVEDPVGQSFASTFLQDGIYVAEANRTPATEVADGWEASIVNFNGLLKSTDPSANASVIRYEGTQVLNQAVIIAKEVIFDDAHVLLPNNISELIIVAESVSSTDGSEIEWLYSDSQADTIPAMQPAMDGNGYDPNVADPAGANGHDGVDGRNGRKGNSGRSAPVVMIFVHSFTDDSSSDLGLPSIRMMGEQGGNGQGGQDAGDGGHGARGKDAKPVIPPWCRSGPGKGGDGGDGGDGGNGGQGGIGGNGGDVFVYHVADLPSHAELKVQLDGGSGGRGGARGAAGDGGLGGRHGKTKGCRLPDDREGIPGEDGARGNNGLTGFRGKDGRVELQSISLEEWQEAFTRPYLINGVDALVGETAVLRTTNIMGPATLYATDNQSGSTYSYTLQELGNGDYAWDVPLTQTASEFTLQVQRNQDGEMTNSYVLSVQPNLVDVEFLDAFEARPGGTAYLTGYGFRGDSEIIFDDVRLQPEAFVDGATGLDTLRFTIPVVATHGDKFVHEFSGLQHTVHLDQPFPLADSESLPVDLKTNLGLTFRPSLNGFEFTNGEMFEAAQAYVTQHGAVGGITGNIEDLFAKTDTWRLFEETYGKGEVAALGGRVSPINWINYGLWYYVAWANPEGGTCTGLSTVALDQFFNSREHQIGRQIEDVQRSTITTFGRQISDELLGLQISQAVIDAYGKATGGPSMTEITVDYVSNFFKNGSEQNSGYAPILFLVPNSDVYKDVIIDGLNLIGESINFLDGISPAESWKDFKESWNQMNSLLQSSHALTPYQVVYENPTDDIPSRIYFYDSNAPGMDSIYLDVIQEDGEVKFDYSMLKSASNSYSFSTDEGWMLGFTPTNLMTNDVDLIIDQDLLIPGATTGIDAAFRLVREAIGDSQFVVQSLENETPDNNQNEIRLLGDLTNDGKLAADDIDQLFKAIENNASEEEFDLNTDGSVNRKDATHLVHDLIGTVFGDINLDGDFDSSDLVLAFQAGEYEDVESGNSTWIDGDWNGDGEFDSADLVLAFQDGGYERRSGRVS